MEKTNALRLLDSHKIEYEVFEYDPSITNAVEVSKVINATQDEVFKTLVTIANNKEHFVFVIPSNASLNLKKAAKVAGVKSIEMLKQKELYNITGYIHGGCSPIGMKKQFKTFIDETSILFDNIYVSAGKVGMNIKISIEELKNFINATISDIID